MNLGSETVDGTGALCGGDFWHGVMEVWGQQQRGAGGGERQGLGLGEMPPGLWVAPKCR